VPEVIYTKKSLEDLNKLPKQVSERIILKINLAKDNPFRYFKRLRGRADYKLRIGHYRVIAEITAGRIEVTKAGHRKDVYDN